MHDERPPVPDPIGGQAVLEGVMMKCGRRWSLAVRDPDGSIHVEVHELPGVDRRWWQNVPVLRGVHALVESLRLGYRGLLISAARQLPDDAPTGAFGGAVAAAVVVFVTMFALAPLLAVHALVQAVPQIPFAVTEGAARMAIFLGYVWAISKIPAVSRVFEYHGAEHQSVSCAEAGLEPTPAAAAGFPIRHPRCGTAFMLWVMVISVGVYAMVPSSNLAVVVASRLVGIPLVAGIAFELIRAAASHQTNRVVRLLTAPGLALQGLTTRVPDEGQLEVAIAALKAVRRPEPATTSF